MIKYDNGSWTLELGGICYRELWELGQILTELGDKGSYNGRDYDLETLTANFDASTGDVFITD